MGRLARNGKNRVRAREGRREGPGCGVMGYFTDEEVDEDGRAAIDADIDEVLVIHCGCVPI